MATDRLVYLPLGGAGEIGMNCYVYGYGPAESERLIVVDLGVTFPDMDTTPGVDLIFADIAWLEERRERIEAIFITHAHEDHIGAVGHLWERLGAPIYARAFTANIARRKMEEHGYSDQTVRTVAAWPETVTSGPFTVGFAPISHSIPESSGLVIDTAKGRIIHTGDFKIDETPGVGEPFDRAMWRDIAGGGVRALICDSTNIFSLSEGRSEASVAPNIEALFKEAKGLVAATTFASNIARVKTLADAGVAVGRSVCLLGRAMRRMIEAAIETGLLTDFPSVVSPEDAKDIPRENLLLLTTGSQGEHRAATAQLSRGKYMGLTLQDGDTFLFSSKTIPGNERSVIRIINQFSEMGVDVVDDSSGDYHVSGHANRPDLMEMHALTNPDLVIPMHGEHRHLRAHARLAEEAGRKSILAVNGTMVDIEDGRAVEYIETGRVYLDGRVQIGQFDGIIRDRIRMARNGHLTVTLILDEDGEPLGDTWCDAMGLAEVSPNNEPLVDLVENALGGFLQRANARLLSDDDKLEQELRTLARRTAEGVIGKKPEVSVVISRLA